MTDTVKDLMLDALVGCDTETVTGDFVLEIPHLVFAMHGLTTQKNKDTLKQMT